jgi:DUF1680 family protein
MLKLNFIGTFILFFLHIHISKAQDIYLDTNWKYSFQDSAAFASPDFNDAAWTEKSGNALMFTAKELVSNNYTCWMRKTFVIPSALKKKLGKAGALSLFLGRVYQTDMCYFNGILVGKAATSDIKRAYLMDEKNIRWDKPNTVALQIKYWGGKAGIEAAPPYIGPAVVANIFTFSASAEGVEKKKQVKNKKAVYVCTVLNNTSKTANGELSASFYDFQNKLLKTMKQKATLTEGSTPVRFSFTSPSNFLKITYTLSVPELNYTTLWNDEFGYNDITYKAAKPLTANKVEEHFAPADMAQQSIKGWLGNRLEANENERLHHVDEDALLAGFINKPGVHPWIGEHVGKFLEAATNAYELSKNPAFKTQIDRTAQQFIASQLQDGYLGTYSLENHWTSWDVWSHKYDIIGLLRYYEASGFEPALNAAKKTGDLLCQTFGKQAGQKDIIKSGTHVGMAATSVLEPMVDLYRFTGDKKYLDFCLFLIESMEQTNGPKIISTLNANGGRVDKTANSKAYEMMSNLVGLLKLYKATADEKYLKPVQLAWNDIISNRLYITGTTSSFEHFKDNGVLPSGQKDNVGEGCVTTTWVQLNYQLLSITGDMKYLNELERSAYNQLTAAENPQTGCVSYFTPLSGIKPFSCNITCCMSSVPRGIAMIPLFANGKINNNPSFLLYQAGRFETTVNNNKVSFITTTDFPKNGTVSIKVNTNKAFLSALNFRKPYWATDFTITINNEKQSIIDGETITINRNWQNNDVITIQFSMPIMVLDGGKTYPNYIALQRGPQVLSVDKNLNNTINLEDISLNSTNISLESTPSVLPNKWVGSEAYQVKAMVNKENKNIILVPFADASQTGGTITTWIKKL